MTYCCAATADLQTVHMCTTANTCIQRLSNHGLGAYCLVHSTTGSKLLRERSTGAKTGAGAGGTRSRQGGGGGGRNESGRVCGRPEREREIGAVLLPFNYHDYYY